MGGTFWPDGIHKADNVLVMAVNEALTVISWFENLPKDEHPPRWIWWSGDLVDKWFEDVERRRKRQMSGKRSTYDSAEEVPMMGNELSDGL